MFNSQGISNTYIFWGVVIISLLLIFAVHPFTMLNGDEGIFVHDAFRLGRGDVPIADYTTRAPIHLVLILFFTKLSGLSILAVRLPDMIATAFTAGVLFLLGKEISSRTFGLVASAFFILIPYTLWNNAAIKSETFAILWMTTAALFLIRALKEGDARLYIYTGIWMGLAYEARHSALAFMLISALAVVWHTYVRERAWWLMGLRKIIWKGSLLFMGTLVGFLPVFLIIAWHNMAAAVGFWFGGFFSTGVFAIKKIDVIYVYGSPILHFVREWALVFTENLGVQAGVLVAGFVVFVGGLVYVLLSRWRRIATIAGAGTPLIFMGAVIAHGYKVFSVGTFRPYVFLYLTLFFVPLAALLWFYTVRNGRMQEFIRSTPYLFVAVLWVLCFFVAYSIFQVGYSREFIPALSLLAASVFVVFPWNQARMVSGIVGICAVGLFVVGASWFWDPPIGWWWRQETINDTTQFLREHTRSEERVFSANPLPVMLAGRWVFDDFYSFSIPIAQALGHRWGYHHTIDELFVLWRENPTRYVLVDGRMKRHVFRFHEGFEKLINQHYNKVATFGTEHRRDWIEVWEIKTVTSDQRK